VTATLTCCANSFLTEVVPNDVESSWPQIPTAGCSQPPTLHNELRLAALLLRAFQLGLCRVLRLMRFSSRNECFQMTWRRRILIINIVSAMARAVCDGAVVGACGNCSGPHEREFLCCSRVLYTRPRGPRDSTAEPRAVSQVLTSEVMCNVRRADS
jgi:hypothetical protein